MLRGTVEMAGSILATRVGACGAALAEDVYPRDGIAGFGGGILCGSLSTDTDVRRALSFRTGMAQYSQHRLRRPSGHIHEPFVASCFQPLAEICRDIGSNCLQVFGAS